MNEFELAMRILDILLRLIGPAVIRQKVDEWEAADRSVEAAFIAKFKEPL